MKPALTIAFILLSLSLFAQAPISVRGKKFDVTISSGNGSLASSGTYFLSFSQVSSYYSITRLAGNVVNSFGTATYSRTGANQGNTSFSDAALGLNSLATLTFSGRSQGTYNSTVTSGAPGSQSGSFSPSTFSAISWQHTSGQIALWLLQYGHYIFSTLADIQPAPAGWELAGVLDVGVDGQPDYVWQHQSGPIALWTTHNGIIIQARYIGPNPGTYWRLKSARDFNSDGHLDLFFAGQQGELAVWYMNAFNYVSGEILQTPVPGPFWKFIGIYDMDENGTDDFLWQDGNGTPGIWYMNGFQIVSATTLPPADSSWRILGVTDVNADGSNDIVWINNHNRLAAWYNGNRNTAALLSHPQVGSDWKALDVE